LKWLESNPILDILSLFFSTKLSFYITFKSEMTKNENKNIFFKKKKKEMTKNKNKNIFFSLKFYFHNHLLQNI